MKEPSFITYRNPWELAFECSKERCDIEEITRVLRRIFMESDVKSREYLWALEFIKAFKANAKEDKVLELALKMFTREVRGKLLRDTSPTTIVSVHEENFYLSMGLLTIWEYLAIVGVHDSIGAYISSLIDELWDDIALNYNKVRDLAKAVIEGPLSMLPENIVFNVVKEIMGKSDKEDTLLFKIELLYSLTEWYNPKILLYDDKHRELLIKSMKNILKKIIELTGRNPEKSISLMKEFMVTLGRIDKLCLTQLMDTKPCDTIRESIVREMMMLFTVAKEKGYI
ncbi:hypothetical protein J4526_07005 [Desulfurococcaceae archaeon MEX13E-LK6-19]|nr:hypothetical protein J4526_07005 [Desulfurococcaceae archaeon MEX13E-LK6-19]